MKQPTSAKRSSVATRRSAPESVDEYLARVPEPARGMLIKMRATIRSAVPAEATETISYGIPAFKHKKVLVWFAAFSNHCSLFPTASVIRGFKDDLKSLSISKGTVHFATDRPLPTALIKKMIKERVAQSGHKKPR
jgi:uncharacterized protein YdhG (YjbR/CyaY superfamily)